jgi:hypothetical protein
LNSCQKDFKEIKDKLSKILLAVGVKHADWTMGGAGIWDETHPYYDANNQKKDSGDIDVMLDEKDLIKAFPDDDIRASKLQAVVLLPLKMPDACYLYSRST